MNRKMNDSETIQLLRLVWNNYAKSAPFSWERLNHAMADALGLAISAGLPFGADDFRIIYNEFRAERWIGGGEGFYAVAIISGHAQACQAFERYCERPAFICDDVESIRARWKRQRTAIGFRFPWKGETVTVTSITPQHLVACSYHTPAGHPAKPLHIYKITLADIKAARKEKRAALEAARKRNP